MSEKALTGEEILKSDDLGTLKVDVPQWGDGVYVRELPYDEALKVIEMAKRNEEDDELMPYIVEVSACGKDGKRLFADGDAQKLRGKNKNVLSEISAASCKFNGLTKKGEETVEGNSEATQPS